MRIFISIFSLVILAIFGCSKDAPTAPEENPAGFETPQQIIGKIMRGINIGNTLEPPEEGGWNNGPLQEYYFDDYKNAGFTCVRIPVRWEMHTAETAPYAIDPDWLDRVEEIVDWGLARDLYLIINAHHEWWLVDNYADPNARERFHSIWRQIAGRFQDKSGKLLFEMINEPHGLTQEEINELNQAILDIIRQTNPQRTVIFSGHEWSGAEQLMSAAVPADDYLMGYFHAYDPWTFAGQAQGLWGTPDDIAAIKAKFEAVANWSRVKNIPVMISEFGAVRDCEYNSRMRHYYTYVEQALVHGVAFQAWDDGGGFGIYERGSRRWPEVKDILIHTDPAGPAMLQATLHINARVYLNWQNRSSDNSRIVIERKTETSDFTEIARLEPGAAEYNDMTPGSDTYYYRVIYNFSSKPDMYSNPVQVVIP